MTFELAKMLPVMAVKRVHTGMHKRDQETVCLALVAKDRIDREKGE